MPTLRRHRALIGYLFILAVAVGALQFHHNRTTAELRESDRKTCRALEEITDNQRFVLGALVLIIAQQTAFAPAPNLITRLEEIDTRMRRLPKYDCTEGLVSVG